MGREQRINQDQIKKFKKGSEFMINIKEMQQQLEKFLPYLKNIKDILAFVPEIKFTVLNYTLTIKNSGAKIVIEIEELQINPKG
jgi:hypothetical protein